MQIDHDTLEIIVEALPLDLCLIDREDRIVWWSKSETRMFRIPPDKLGEDVRDCHPGKSIDTVDKMLDLMKRGEGDEFKMWVDVKHQGIGKVLITYRALRDENGEYLGCIEIDQAVEEIMNLEGERKISDIL